MSNGSHLGLPFSFIHSMHMTGWVAILCEIWRIDQVRYVVPWLFRLILSNIAIVFLFFTNWRSVTYLRLLFCWVCERWFFLCLFVFVTNLHVYACITCKKTFIVDVCLCNACLCLYFCNLLQHLLLPGASLLCHDRLSKGRRGKKRTQQLQTNERSCSVLVMYAMATSYQSFRCDCACLFSCCAPCALVTSRAARKKQVCCCLCEGPWVYNSSYIVCSSFVQSLEKDQAFWLHHSKKC